MGNTLIEKKYRSVWATKVGIASIVCFLLVIGCILLDFYIVRASNAALHELLCLKKSMFYEKNFYVMAKGKYKLAIHDNEPSDNENQEIEKSLKKMKTKWQITRYGKPVECHSILPVEIYHYNTVGRKLCSFNANPGKYHIKFQFTEKPDDILIENSRILLDIREISPDDAVEVWLIILWLYILEFLFGAIGIICFIFAKIPKIEPPIDWSKR